MQPVITPANPADETVLFVPRPLHIAVSRLLHNRSYVAFLAPTKGPAKIATWYHKERTAA